MKTPNIQKRISNFLMENGQSNTREIYDHFLDTVPSRTPTMYQLGNVLAKHPGVEKMIDVEKWGIKERNLRYALWRIRVVE